MTTTRKLYQYGCSAQVTQKIQCMYRETTERLMRESLQRHCATNRLQMVGEVTFAWRREPADRERPWRVYATCEAIKLGRRKQPYPLIVG